MLDKYGSGLYPMKEACDSETGQTSKPEESSVPQKKNFLFQNTDFTSMVSPQLFCIAVFGFD